jgi:hypothetical protein
VGKAHRTAVLRVDDLHPQQRIARCCASDGEKVFACAEDQLLVFE